MLKVYFNTPVPFSERKKVLYGLKSLGFKFDRLFVPGSDVSHFRFFGRLPCGDSCCFASFIFDDEAKRQFKGVRVDYVELFIDFEKRGNK